MTNAIAVLLVMTQTLFQSLGQQTSAGLASISASSAPQVATTTLPYTFNCSGNKPFGIGLFLPFCYGNAVQSCIYTRVRDCDECSMVGAGFFCFFVVLLGFGALFGNGLVIWVFAKDKSTFTGTYGQIKVSLAVSDILTSITFLCIILPNFVRTLDMTACDIWRKLKDDKGTPHASVGGFFHILIYAASFYHLVLLAQQRLYAVAFPIRYQQQKAIYVYISIALVWFTSFLIAAIPLFYPKPTEYVYSSIIFLFSITSNNLTFMRTQFSFMTVVPYSFVVCLTVACGICLHRSHKTRKRMTASNSKEAKRRQNMVFLTLVLMILGLTLTTGPYVTVVLLQLTSFWRMPNFAAVFVSCYYLSSANSIVNVIVYSLMDEKFRKASRNILRSLFCLKEEEGSHSSFSRRSAGETTLATRLPSASMQ